MKHVLTALILAAATPAFAQKPAGELQVNTVRGPAQELYIRKRPSSPEAPVLSKDLKELLTSTEKRRDDKRIEAIGLLKQFLDSKPTGDAKAEGMFKLAELLWEEARRLYLIEVDAFSRAVEKCTQKKACEPSPKEPRIDLKQAEALYAEAAAFDPAGGQRGHPVAFGGALGDELARLDGDEGARSLLARHAERLVAVPVGDPGIFRDVDTPSDLQGMP